MKQLKNFSRYFYSVCLLVGLMTACSPLIATFDQYAYTQTTSLKVDVINLIDKSDEPFESHKKEVSDIVSSLHKIKEYEKHRPKDGVTVLMWEKMIDSTGRKGIIGRYLASWEKGAKKEAMINEYKVLIAAGFDIISELEAKKIKSSDSQVQNFIKN